MDTRHDVTRLLADLKSGKVEVSDELFALVYDELRTLASRHMRGEHPGHTLQTTALVNEAYLRLAGDPEPSWEDRVHFLRVASAVMRRILVDSARRRLARKRGGDRDREPLRENTPFEVERSPVDLIALDEALGKLAEIDPHAAQVVELRFFGGLTVAETAKVLGVSERALAYDWRLARVWLREQLDGGGAE